MSILWKCPLVEDCKSLKNDKLVRNTECPLSKVPLIYYFGDLNFLLVIL